MAFTSTITGDVPNVAGVKKITFGTFTSDGGTAGGDVDTGLKFCESLILQSGGASVATNAPSVNETLPVAGNAVTIVTDANATGYWIAYGI